MDNSKQIMEGYKEILDKKKLNKVLSPTDRYKKLRTELIGDLSSVKEEDLISINIPNNHNEDYGKYMKPIILEENKKGLGRSKLWTAIGQLAFWGAFTATLIFWLLIFPS